MNNPIIFAGEGCVFVVGAGHRYQSSSNGIGHFSVCTYPPLLARKYLGKSLLFYTSYETIILHALYTAQGGKA